MLGIKQPSETVELSPSSGRYHFSNGCRDADANIGQSDEARTPFLAQDDIQGAFERINRASGASISANAKAIVTLLFAHVSHKAQAVRDLSVEFATL